MCQDTGTAIVMGKKGQRVWTGGDDAAALAAGIRRTYHRDQSALQPGGAARRCTRRSTPATICRRRSTSTPTPGDEYKFLFIAKGGGSANKSFLYQQTKAVLNPKSLLKFLDEKIRTLGTAACPPYHLAIVIGGTSAEMNLKTVKLASCRYLDTLPTAGNKYGQAFRDRDFEAEVLELTRDIGIGAQFGGKYFCHDVRVIRLPRHGASLPIGIGVSCSADRQILGKITADGVFLEELETNPAQYPAGDRRDDARRRGRARSTSTRPMAEIRRTLVAIPDQDAALAHRHADRRARHRPCQAARSGSTAARACRNTSRTIRSITPARPRRRRATPRARSARPRPGAWIPMSTRSWRPAAASSRSPRAIAAPRCARPASKHGGFYLGSIGGPAARLAQDCIKKVEVLEYPELGMEAIWRIEVVDFPAFIVVDDKGNDFFAKLA